MHPNYSVLNQKYQPAMRTIEQLSSSLNEIRIKIENNLKDDNHLMGNNMKISTKSKKLKKEPKVQFALQKESATDQEQYKKNFDEVRECVTVKNCHRNITNKIFRLFKINSFRVILMRLCAYQNIQLSEFLEYFDEDMRKNFTNIEFLTQQWTIFQGDLSNENKLRWIFREFYRFFLEKCSLNYLLLGPTRDKQAYLNTIIQMLRYIDKPKYLTTFMMSKHKKIMQKVQGASIQSDSQEQQSSIKE